MSQAEENTLVPLPRSYLETLLCQASYRAEMCVTEVRICKSPYLGETGYYVCPRCHITLEREFVTFCDRCGQKLSWKGYKKAKVICQGTG